MCMHTVVVKTKVTPPPSHTTHTYGILSLLMYDPPVYFSTVVLYSDFRILFD